VKRPSRSKEPTTAHREEPLPRPGGGDSDRETSKSIKGADDRLQGGADTPGGGASDRETSKSIKGADDRPQGGA